MDRTNKQKIFATARDYVQGIYDYEILGNVDIANLLKGIFNATFYNRSVGETFNTYDGSFVITKTDLLTIVGVRECVNLYMMDRYAKRSHIPLFNCLCWLESNQG